MTGATDQVEDAILATIGEADPTNPDYWERVFGAMEDADLRRAWATRLTEDRLPETTLDTVFRWLATRLSVGVGAVRAEYRDRLRTMNADEPETHGEWARWYADGLATNFASDGLFWLYDDEARIFRGLTIEHAANEISEQQGKRCQTASDYKQIAGLAYSIREQQSPDMTTVAPQGIAAMDKFYRLTSEGIEVEPLQMEHYARFKIDAEPEWNDDGLFAAFVDRIADEEQQILLRQHFAAVLFGIQWKMQKAVLWYGPGATGKSTMQKILESVVPEELISAVPPQNWEREYHAAAMAGKVLNVVGEIEERWPLGAAFKNVIGGGRIDARHPTHRPFSYVSRAAQVFCSNYLPPSSDRSDAFWRRWSIVEFINVIPDGERDPHLADKIKKKELGSILAFAMKGAEEILSASEDDHWRFMISEHQQRVEDKWRLEINSVAAFINDEDTVVRSQEACVGKALLFKEYSRWCLDNNQRPLGRMKFNREMTDNVGIMYNITVGRTDSGTKVWQGIGLVDRENREAF